MAWSLAMQKTSSFCSVKLLFFQVSFQITVREFLGVPHVKQTWFSHQCGNRSILNLPKATKLIFVLWISDFQVIYATFEKIFTTSCHLVEKWARYTQWGYTGKRWRSGARFESVNFFKFSLEQEILSSQVRKLGGYSRKVEGHRASEIAKLIEFCSAKRSLTTLATQRVQQQRDSSKKVAG